MHVQYTLCMHNIMFITLHNILKYFLELYLFLNLLKHKDNIVL